MKTLIMTLMMMVSTLAYGNVRNNELRNEILGGYHCVYNIGVLEQLYFQGWFIENTTPTDGLHKNWIEDVNKDK